MVATQFFQWTIFEFIFDYSKSFSVDIPLFNKVNNSTKVLPTRSKTIRRAINLVGFRTASTVAVVVAGLLSVEI